MTEPVRQFAWSNMFVTPEEDPRSEGGFVGERANLVGYLRDYRLTLEMKCAGLDAEQLARRSVPPSTMSLLGLVRHMARVERIWFRKVHAGLDVPDLFRTPEQRDADWDGAVGDPAVVEEAFRLWREEIAFAEKYVEGVEDLGAMSAAGDEPVSLREVLLHMVEEYARHCGHADLLRERVDGRVGQ
ncbi:DinB family protein [Streptomyces sp. NPDC052225]|uniref:DinB family protein n=1 Tax=Streptomyces sp. NPDC052225 TaxID=3154949 RepID=UPI00342B6A95